MTELAKREQGQITVGKVITQAIGELDNMIQAKMFDTPENYSYKNAIQQARFLLNKPAESGKNQGKTIMEICTPQSILQSVIEMAQKGLNPDKKQCYFIPYGSTCQLSVSYQGNIALAKRSGQDIDDVLAYPIYKDDEFEIGFNAQKGVLQVKKYKPDVTKWDKENLIGAFAVVIDTKGEVKYTEYMTITQIRSAWNMGFARGGSPAHKNFPDQMALKTVKNRAVKSYINSSDDSELFRDEKSIAYTDSEFQKELSQNANMLEIDTTYEEVKEEPREEEKATINEETGEIIDGQQSAFTPEQAEEMINNVPF